MLIYKNPNELISQQSKVDRSASQIRRLTKSMQANGYDAHYPITGVERPDGRIVISDGHDRVLAAIAAGIRIVPIDVYRP
jgi:ParB-like chromosome segregation protein Spo0J